MNVKSLRRNPYVWGFLIGIVKHVEGAVDRFHGQPERQCIKSDDTRAHCLASPVIAWCF
jgi:hypothetical protein